MNLPGIQRESDLLKQEKTILSRTRVGTLLLSTYGTYVTDKIFTLDRINSFFIEQCLQSHFPILHPSSHNRIRRVNWKIFGAQNELI